MNRQSTPDSGQLNGWKSIAAFFGKTPRTVQRWEANLGLPVKRIRTPGGEIVFALRPELEAWRDEQSRLPGSQINDPEDASADPGGENGGSGPGGSASNRRRSLLVVGGTFCLLALTATGVTFGWRRLSPPRVVDAELTNSAIVARDAGGRELWTFDVGHMIAQIGDIRMKSGDPRVQRARRPDNTPLVADLNGDGRSEVVAVIGRRVPGLVHVEQTLVCLSSTGRLLWSYRPEDVYQFGGERFGPPWLVTDVIVAGRGSAASVWVSFTHAAWWPSMVVRIDAGGAASTAFVNAGSIYTLSELPADQGSRVLAGGVNNEWNAAMLTVVTSQGPLALSPQVQSAFVCVGCRGAVTANYILLPPTHFNVADTRMPGYNWVIDTMAEIGDKRVVTWESEQWNIQALYLYSTATGVITRFGISDGARRTHRQLEEAGVLKHAQRDCPYNLQAEVRYADGRGGWESRMVPAQLNPTPGPSPSR